MGARGILRYLEQLCDDIDNGRTPRRARLRRALAPLVIPAAIGLAGLGGCSAAEVPETETAHDQVIVVDADQVTQPGDVVIVEPAPTLYAAPMPPPIQAEDCRDGIDNDLDGAVDCADSDCAGPDVCPVAVAAYAAPMPVAEVCGDGIDNDLDGAFDCDDSDCASLALCTVAVAEYAAPFPRAEVCGDGIDNDRDGTVDCADSDCASFAACLPRPVARYRAPFPVAREICGDGIDNDRDGAVDCADSDCPCPPPVALYAAPMVDVVPDDDFDRPAIRPRYAAPITR